MIKTVLNTAYDFGEQSAHIIGVSDRGLDCTHLTKAASNRESVFKDVEIKPEKGKAIVHVVAMGSAPHYPCNKNGDLFYDTARKVEIPEGEDIQLEKGLDESHVTFETDAKVFKEHFNNPDKGDKIYGDVVKARFNDDLKRVELLLSIPVEEWEDELGGIDKGNSFGVSMSCRLPADVCSYCGHASKTTADYCDHLKYQLGQILEGGHQIAAINDKVTFFDISGVKNPADRIAFGLLKAASTSKVVGGAQLAKMLHIPEPELPEQYKFAATIRKLAQMEKEIEGQGEIIATNPECAAAETPNIPEEVMDKLANCGLSPTEILGALSDVKVTLSLHDFIKILMGPKFNEVRSSIPDAEKRLPGVFSRMAVNPVVQDGVIELPTTPFPFSLGSELKDLISSNGFGADSKRKRVTITVIRGGSPYKVKSASVTPSSGLDETMAQLYGQYKVSMCHKFFDDNDLTFTSALSHYIAS